MCKQPPTAGWPGTTVIPVVSSNKAREDEGFKNMGKFHVTWGGNTSKELEEELIIRDLKWMCTIDEVVIAEACTRKDFVRI